MRRRRSSGAALLMAMLIVALVSTLASGMAWQQWRAAQVETAERSRNQAAWILSGALDWSILILREDGRADRAGGGQPRDHLGEPWATPLAEARLSTFLAADREQVQEDLPQAFLSGQIGDAQSRYNLRNLVSEQKLVAEEVAKLARLVELQGLPASVAATVAEGVEKSWRPQAPGHEVAGSPLPVQRFEHLARLGIDEAVLQRLRPVFEVLPRPTPVNLNTAPAEVLAGVLGVDRATAQRLVQARQSRPFGSVEQARGLIAPDFPIEKRGVSVSSAFFEIRGRLRLEERVLEERSLVERTNAEVVIHLRERVSSIAQGP